MVTEHFRNKLEENEVMLAHQYKSNYQTIITRVKNRFLPKTVHLIGTLGEIHLFACERICTQNHPPPTKKRRKKKITGETTVHVNQFHLTQQN